MIASYYRCVSNNHYEKSYTGMNVFRKGMNSFRNGMNMFRTGMKTFRIGTGIRGNQNYQKIRNFSGSKNLKEFFQNSKVLKSSYQTKPNLKSWNFEKNLSDSKNINNSWILSMVFIIKIQKKKIFVCYICSILYYICSDISLHM